MGLTLACMACMAWLGLHDMAWLAWGDIDFSKRPFGGLQTPPRASNKLAHHISDDFLMILTEEKRPLDIKNAIWPKSEKTCEYMCLKMVIFCYHHCYSHQLKEMHWTKVIWKSMRYQCSFSTPKPASHREDFCMRPCISKPVTQRQEMVIGTLTLLWYFLMVAVM